MEDILGLPSKQPGYRKMMQEEKHTDVLGLPERTPITTPDLLDLKPRKESNTFDWMDVVGKAAKSTPILPSLQFGAELSAREEAAVAKPILDIMRGETPDPKAILAGPASLLVTPPKNENDEYDQLGDIFREWGWNEPAAATAGLVLSLALPSNFLLGGFAGKSIQANKLFAKGAKLGLDPIAKKAIVRDFATNQAGLEAAKAKVLPMVEKYFDPVIYQEMKEQVLKSPDILAAKSILFDASKRQAALATVKPNKGISFGDRLRRGYQDSLPVAKAMDAKDGYKHYQGTQSTMARNIMRGSTHGEYAGILRKQLLMEELENRGMKDIPFDPDAEFRLSINSYARQGEADAVKSLLKSKGLTEIPKLLPNEEIVLDAIIKDFDKHYDDLARIYETVEGKPLGKIKNYTHALKYDGEVEPGITSLLNQAEKRKFKRNPSAFLKERQGSELVPRSDFWALVDETMSAQEWYKGTMPDVLTAQAKLIDPSWAEEFGEKAGMYAEEFAEYLTAVKNQGRLTQDNVWSGFLRQARGNITQATLSWKLSSALLQFGTLWDGMAFAANEWGVGAMREIVAEVTKSWIKPGYKNALVKGSKGLTVRAGKGAAGEEALTLQKEISAGKVAKKLGEVLPALKGATSENIGKAYEWFTRTGMGLLQGADLRTAAGIEEGVKKILKRRGIKDADDQADFFMQLINGSSDAASRPMVLNRGEGAKTMFTFQTFFLHRWSLIAHDLAMSGLAKGNYKQKLTALLGLSLLGAGQVAEDQSRKFIWENTTGRKVPGGDDESLLQQMMWSYFTNIPFFGPLGDALMRGRSAEPPLVRQFENMVIGSKQVVKGKKAETKGRGAMKVLEAGATLAGIPGTGQLFDIADRLIPDPEKKIEYPKSKQAKLKSQILKGL